MTLIENPVSPPKIRKNFCLGLDDRVFVAYLFYREDDESEIKIEIES